MSTIFQKIIDKEIPAQIVHEDELSMAFRDINPIAPVHLLVIPKKAIKSIQEASSAEDLEIISHLFAVIQKLAAQEGLDKKGYRLITNVGQYGGQTVYHLHFHLIGGRELSWPPE